MTGMGFGSRLAYAVAALGIIDLVIDLCIVAATMFVTNNLGDIASHAIILELLENAYEK